MRNDQRPTRVGAELILREGRPLLPGLVQEEIVCIQHLVAQVFIRLPVQPVAARFRAQVDDAARKLTPIRSEIAGLHFELLNGILRWNQNRQVDVANIERLTVEVFGALIAEGSVYLVVSPAKGVYADGRAAGTSLWDNCGGKGD